MTSVVNLSNQDLRAVDLSNTNLRDSILSSSLLSKQNLMGKDISGADLSGAFLADSILQKCNFHSSNFQKASLSKANLSLSNLQNSLLQNSILQGANLRGANLRGANLKGADIRDANFREANLQGTIFPSRHRTRLNLENFSHAVFDINALQSLGVSSKEAAFFNLVVIEEVIIQAKKLASIDLFDDAIQLVSSYEYIRKNEVVSVLIDNWKIELAALCKSSLSFSIHDGSKRSIISPASSIDSKPTDSNNVNPILHLPSHYLLKFVNKLLPRQIRFLWPSLSLGYILLSFIVFSFSFYLMIIYVFPPNRAGQNVNSSIASQKQITKKYTATNRTNILCALWSRKGVRPGKKSKKVGYATSRDIFRVLYSNAKGLRVRHRDTLKKYWIDPNCAQKYQVNFF